MPSSPTSQVQAGPAGRRLTLPEKEEIVRRFNERVEAAIRAAPDSKEWVRKALARGGAPRCPVRLRRLSLDIIIQYGDDLADLYCAYPDDAVFALAYDLFIGYQNPAQSCPITPVAALTEDSQWTDEWGTRWQHVKGGVGASPVGTPIQDWSQLDDFLAGKMPDARAPGRLAGALPAIRQHAKSKYCCALAQLALFERLHCLRGMDRTFEDFYLFPRELERLLDVLTAYYVELIGAWGRLGNVDGFFLTDDWGTQTSLMISPRMWRTFFAARYRRICDEAHRWGMQLIFHSCGNVYAIIGDLIDCGVDVIDPLQPEAMDLDKVAREFGGKVAFSGGISDQELAALSPGEVKDHVRRSLDNLGKRFQNAYIAAPANILLPDVPLANLVALFEACHNQ